MERGDFALKDACLVLEDLIKKDKEKLDNIHQEIQSRDPNISVPRAHVEKATVLAAIESLKHNLATLQGEIKAFEKPASSCHMYPVEILNNVSIMWQSESALEIEELLVHEKLRQSALKEEIRNKSLCVGESTKLLVVLNQEKKTLGSKQEELENLRVKELEEKLAKVRRLYSEMKLHLKNTVEAYFPEPQIPGFCGMYNLLTELTQRHQNRERDTYIKLSSAVWPYYVETLERHGIIERHPSDKEKIRIIDFSDGRLGS